MSSECQGMKEGRKEEQAERGGWMEGGREGRRESGKGKGVRWEGKLSRRKEKKGRRQRPMYVYAKDN